MRTKTSLPSAARALIAATVVAGVASVTIRLADVGRWTTADLAALIGLATVTVFGEQLSMRIRLRTETKHITLTEASYAVALMLGVRFSVLTAAVAVGVAVGHSVRGTRPVKVAFNTGSWVASVTVAEMTFGATVGVGSVPAVVLSMAAFFVVNSATVVGVIALVEGRSFASVFRRIAVPEIAQAVAVPSIALAGVALAGAAPVLLPVLLPGLMVVAGLEYRRSQRHTGLLRLAH